MPAIGKKNQPKKALTAMLTADILSYSLSALRGCPSSEPVFQIHLPNDPRFEPMDLVRKSIEEIASAGIRFGQPYGRMFTFISWHIDFHGSRVIDDELVILLQLTSTNFKSETK